MPDAPPTAEDNGTSRSCAAGYSLTDTTIPILEQAQRIQRKPHNTVDGALPSVDLFSRSHVGLAVHCIASGAVFTFFLSVYRPLLVASLGIYHQEQFNAARRFFEWPCAFAVVIGIVADCSLTTTYRRKAAMVAGWLLAMSAFAIITMLSLYPTTSGSAIYFGDSKSAKRAIQGAEIQTRPITQGYLFITLSVAADVGLQLSWIVSLIFVLEYAQREALQVRGRLFALYLLIFYSAASVVDILAITLLQPAENGALRASIDLSLATTAMTLACGVAVPFVMVKIPTNPLPRVQTPLLEQVKILWHTCQQSAINRVLMFLLGFSLLLRAYHSQIHTAVAMWCGVTPTTELYAHAAKTVALWTTLLVWRRRLVNTNWRRLVTLSAAVQIALPLLFVLTVAYIDAVRGEILYVFVSMVVEIPSAIVLLLVQLIATELAEPGAEGSTLGLLISCEALARIASPTGEAMLSSIVMLFDDEATATVANLPSDLVSQAAVAFFVINALSITLVPLLPMQKNHAQRLRGESTRSYVAACGLAIALAVLLVFDGMANAMLMV